MRTGSFYFEMSAVCAVLVTAGCVVASGGDEFEGTERSVYATTSGGTLIQEIATARAEDFETFLIGADTYLAVANSFDGTTGAQSSGIYRWNETLAEYELLQTITTEYAMGWEQFTIAGDDYLAIASQRTTTPWTNNINSEIYQTSTKVVDSPNPKRSRPTACAGSSTWRSTVCTIW